MDDIEPSTVDIDPPRRFGRTKGMPRVPGSGRRKGAPNTVTKDVRQVIEQRLKPQQALGQILAGKPMKVGVGQDGQPILGYPTIEQRLRAAAVLLAKIVPDLRQSSTELTGANGGPVRTQHQSDPEDMQKVARAIAETLIYNTIGKPKVIANE